MTLKATRIRLTLLAVTMTAMLGAVVLAGAIGPLTGLLGSAVAWAAPSAQEPPPAVSFTSTEIDVQEGGTASLGISLSSSATSDLEVAYTIAWPDGRDGVKQGNFTVTAGESTATAEVSVEDDDDVGLKAQDVLTVTLDDPARGSGYTLGSNYEASVTILEGICDRSERVQSLILNALATADECHDVTDSDLASAPKLTGALYWGRGKLIPTDDSEDERESKRPWLKAGDFRGMSGATELYLGLNELQSLPSGVFDGLSNLKKLYASNNLIEELEPGVFAGLTSLTELGLGENRKGGFQLTPKLKPSEGNSFVVEIPEGAPFNVKVTLSAGGGTLSADSVTIPAGDTDSPQVMVSPSRENSSVGVKITDAAFTSGNQYEITVSGDDELNIPRPTISVIDSKVEAPESSSAEVRLSVSPSPQLPITINYELGSDAAADTVDADLRDHGPAVPVAVPSGANNAVVPVQIIEDTDIDDGAREVLLLRLVEGDDPRTYVLGAADSATIIIKEGVCDRTDVVQAVILNALGKGGDECAEVTDDELANYSDTLDLSRGTGVASLKRRDFMGLSSLTELNLATASVTDLPPGVFDGLGLLTTLSLHDSSLASLDKDVFSNLTSLENLFLENNNLTALPAALFSGLTSLENLRLDNNQLTTLPAALFSGLTSLENLRLENNNLTTLPAAMFSGLTSLENLRLDNNQLTALPVALFSGLTRLETLQLDNNQLAALPVALFSGLTSLETLQLDNNQLTTLPAAMFSGPTSLETLQLDNNQLTALPAALFSGLTSLETLRLDNNQLTALPAALFSGLTNLITLQLDNNQLAALPVALFSGLTSLETLRLDNNQLAALPAAMFSGLANLVVLNVADNELAALPAGIFLGLDSLSEIDFSANNDGESLELTAQLVKRDSPNARDGFVVSVATPHGWPGPMEVDLSGANATPAATTINLVSGTGDSGNIPFEWVDRSMDATVCLVSPDDPAFRSSAASFEGLKVKVTPETCVTVPPPPATRPTVKITDVKVTHIEGEKAQISFELSSEADEQFNLNYSTGPDGDTGTDDATKYDDYLATGTVIVEEDAVTGFIPITIVNDTEIDAGILEYFVVELSAPSEGDPYLVDSTSFKSTVIINDGICDRAEVVQDAIIGKLDGTPSCHQVTKTDLAGIEGKLTLAKTTNPVTLQAGEFRGLINVETLVLSVVNLSLGLPEGIFEGLDSVTKLYLCISKISSLTAGVFSGLESLTHLYLDHNSIPSLPAELFRGAGKLEEIHLYRNEIVTLDANVFSGATALKVVRLHDNDVRSLPRGLFSGLSNLTDLKLHGNRVDPFEVSANIEDKGEGSFVVEVVEGAPFDITVPFTVTGPGSVDVSSVTVPAGLTESNTLTINYGQSSGNVTIKPGKPTWTGGSTVTDNLTGVSLVPGPAVEIYRAPGQ